MWPVAPTPFHDNGEVDYEGMDRVIDCMVDQKVEGICILANYSEQFLISDEEREKLTKLCMEKMGHCPTELRLHLNASQYPLPLGSLLRLHARQPNA